jgi:Microtubule-binding stalk of dynein motor
VVLPACILRGLHQDESHSEFNNGACNQHGRMQVMRNDAFSELQQALPALRAAEDALNALNKNDIVEVKTFPKPPALVQLTMEGVCILLGEKPDWDTARKVRVQVYAPPPASHGCMPSATPMPVSWPAC